jgi:branched-chain amino acid aminotransferase
MAIHSRILHNREIREASEPALRAGQLGLLAGWGVFTTLRVAEGALFAWERHWARLTRDARLLNLTLPADPNTLESDLIRLVEANRQTDCTLRLVIVRNAGGMWEGPHGGNLPSDVIAMTATSKAWGESAILDITPNARFAANEFAGAKVLSWSQNLTWAERAHLKGYDETVLLNERGTVAECTSANIFAVFGNAVFTPPLADGCLSGITREVLLNEIHIPGIEIAERTLTVEDLYAADEVFITSTTRDLMPVREIAGRALRGVPDVSLANVSLANVRLKITEKFRRFVAADIAGRKPATVHV